MKREDLLTVNQAAEVKNVSRQAIWAAIKDERLPVIKVRTVVVRIAPEALAKFTINPNMQKRNGKKGGRPRTKGGTGR